VLSDKKILVVEDDAAIREMYVMKLLSQDAIVEKAENGVLGLQKALSFNPDLILLDLKMPLMSGTEMLKLLRAKESAMSIRVIILTNISKSEAPHELRLLRVDRYLVKAHHTPSQIAATIAEVLHSK
jgi:DNA-binding response OmpR family regulator